MKNKEMGELLDKLGVTFHGSRIRELLWDAAIDLESKHAKPKTKEKHLGIELEGFCKKEIEEILKYVSDYNMSKILFVSTDCSIRSPRGFKGYELKLILPEKKLDRTLKKLDKFLKAIRFKTNSSCGLHVHLDMRSRKYKQVARNLAHVQKIMSKLVTKSRRNNRFCSIVEDIEFLVSGERYRSHNWWDDSYRWETRGPDRQSAINAYHAYRKHKTIEVRLHHATTDIKVIKNWINLLLSVVSCRKKLDKVDTKKKLFDNVKLKYGVKTYVENTYRARAS